jgi:hypothetical protein
MNFKDGLIYMFFGIGTLLLIYFGCIGINATMSDTFPNVRFFIILILMIVVTFSIGLGLRKHRLLIAGKRL